MSEETNNTEKLTIQKEKLTGVMSAKQVSETISEAIADANAKNAEVLKETLTEVAKIIKAPTEAEAKKQRQEDFLERRKQEMRRQEAIQSEQGRLDREASCAGNGHKIPKAGGGYRHGFRAQLNSDNAFRPQCINCWKQFPPIKASQSMITGGTSINDYLMQIENLDENLLIESSKKTYPEWWTLQANKEKERAEFKKAFSYEEQAV
jgi:ribosomal protein S18